MKRLLIVAVLASSMFACNQKELTSLKEQNQQLKTEAAEKESQIVNFMESFSQIEQNLAEIRERELSIALSNSEDNVGNKSIQQKINEDIQAIDQLIAENQNTIEELNKQIANSNGKNVRLNKMLNDLKLQLTDQIDERNQQIALMKEDLERMNFTVEKLHSDLDTMRQNNDNLALENKEKEELIERKTDEMNTAYVAVGSVKELEEGNIIIKEGGFLGLGKTEKLAADLNATSFQKVDIRELTNIPVAAKKIEFVTPHPEGSYQIKGEKTVESIEITNPDEFWHNSKYLVVRLD